MLTHGVVLSHKCFRGPRSISSQMEIFDCFLALSLLLGISRASTDGICQNINFAINKNVVPDHALEGHVFKNLTVDKVTNCHVMCREDCRCISMNYVHNKQQDNCELNDVNKEMDPTGLKYKAGASYYDLEREYKVDVSPFSIAKCYSQKSVSLKDDTKIR